MPSVRSVLAVVLCLILMSMQSAASSAETTSRNTRLSVKVAAGKPKPAKLVMVYGTIVNGYDEPVYRIHGTAVRIDTSGKPVKKTSVASGITLGASFISEQKGKFTIKLSPGTYKLSAEATSQHAVTLAVPEDKPSISVKVLFGLPAKDLPPKAWRNKTVTIHGTAVSITGKTLPNVKGHSRYLPNGMLGPEWKSGPDGKFIIKVKPGRYSIWAFGAEKKTIEFTAKADYSYQHVEVISSPHNGLLLKFETPDGRPLTNAILAMGMFAGKGSIATDANGFALASESRPVPLHRFFALKGVGYADLNVTDEKVIHGEDPVVVRLHSGPFVSGRVVSGQDDTPLGGVPIFPSRKSYEGDPWSWWGSQYGFKSFTYTIGDAMAISRDGDGTFSVGPLPPGKYDFVTGLDGIGHEFPSTDLIVPEEHTVDLSQGTNHEGLDISVSLKEPVYTLQGRILKGDGTALVSTEMTIDVSGDYAYPNEPEEWYVWEPVVRTVVTDTQGNYKLYPVRPGTYKLVAKWKDLSASKVVTLTTSKTGINFTLGR